MKTKKISLHDLKVKSFLTSLKKEHKSTVAGGMDSGYSMCLDNATELCYVVRTPKTDDGINELNPANGNVINPLP